MKSFEIEIEIHAEGGVIDDLVVTELRGEERVGAPYRFDVEVMRKEGRDPLELDDLVSTRATLRFVHREDHESRVLRWVHGRISRVDGALDLPAGTEPRYELTIEPELATLGRFASQEIFVGQSVPSVIESKLTAAHFSTDDFSMRLLAKYLDGDGAPGAEREGRLVMQYRESDLAFLSRLAEHSGISFFFMADEKRETLVFTDDTSGFAELDGPVPFHTASYDPGVRGLRRRLSSVRSDFYVYDYNYRTPTLSYQSGGAQLFDVIGGESHLDVPSAGAAVEYAPNAKTPEEAAHLARVRAEEEEGRRERIVGHGVDARLYPGLRFAIANAPQWTEEDPLLVVTMTHQYTAGAFREGQKPSTYRNDFEAVRATKLGPSGAPLVYRPERRTPKPRIHGIVTGVVQSPMSGQSAVLQHLDGQGRYVVKLHLDPSTKTMPRTRMAQPHSGEAYGHHFPLRPGAEVLVAFLDGDPDRPVIVGTVPNPVEVSPVVRPLDGQPVELSRIRTRSGVLIEISDGPLDG